jgi:hypothetical protein
MNKAIRKNNNAIQSTGFFDLLIRIFSILFASFADRK